MHQNGRDTHVRSIKILGPSTSSSTSSGTTITNQEIHHHNQPNTGTNNNTTPITTSVDSQNILRFAPPLFSSIPGGTIR